MADRYHVWKLNAARTVFIAETRRALSSHDNARERAAVWEKRSAANKWASRNLEAGAYMVRKCEGETCGPCRTAPEPARQRPAAAVQETYKLAKRLTPEAQRQLRDYARELGAA